MKKLTFETVEKARAPKRMGRPPGSKSRTKPGYSLNRATLTRDEMHEMVRAGVSQSEIARRAGVSRQRVHAMVRYQETI